MGQASSLHRQDAHATSHNLFRIAINMEPLTTYVIAHGCLLVAVWLLTYADNRPLLLTTRYLGGKTMFKRSMKLRITKIWF